MIVQAFCFHITESMRQMMSSVSFEVNIKEKSCEILKEQSSSMYRLVLKILMFSVILIIE